MKGSDVAFSREIKGLCFGVASCVDMPSVTGVGFGFGLESERMLFSEKGKMGEGVLDVVTVVDVGSQYLS